MTTITDIRNDLISVFNKLRDGTMEAKDAVEMNNTAGKIISSVKVQLAHAALRGERPEIPFLMDESNQDISPPLICHESAAIKGDAKVIEVKNISNSAFPSVATNAFTWDKK